MGISRVDMDPPPAKMWEKMNISPAKWDEKILTEPEKKGDVSPNGIVHEQKS